MFKKREKVICVECKHCFEHKKGLACDKMIKKHSHKSYINGKYYCDENYALCKHINPRGNCKLFEAIESEGE